MPMPTFPAAHEPTADEFAALLPLYGSVSVDQPSLSDATTTTQVAITGLSVALVANATYEVKVLIRYTGAASGTPTAPDISISNTTPAGTTLYSFSPGMSTASSTGFNSLYNGDTPFFGQFGTDGNVTVVLFDGLAITTATAGNMTMTFARNTAASGSITTVKAGSFMIARRVA